jgi:prolyl-tRNA synthetase
VEKTKALLDEIQASLLQKALEFRKTHTVEIGSKEEFYEFFKDEKGGGFALCHWNQDPAIEAKVKEDLNVTIRCIPLHFVKKEGKCIFTGEKSPYQVIFSKAY